ncbi:asparagine synthase related protein [Patellaria atrata CBS 101060]|uniref:Asparagine synthase related protein n=1 Tax=Patellaria atrata CBS 101060 TaxID=1346257 RepID=A0A9P4S3L2_9PEZI|nr:asparagine synthase related protein [Patellaria atrata CBS 101060]
MCGIFFSLSSSDFIVPSPQTLRRLQSRGPDSTREHRVEIQTLGFTQSGTFYLCFVSTVLSLRGENIVAQPLVDDATGSVLCWNGEAWKVNGSPIDGNDSKAVFDLLLQVSATTKALSPDGNSGPASKNILDAISSIAGPYAFVFYDAPFRRILYGRDCLGRRSLLFRADRTDEITLCSIADIPTTRGSWHEVEADGLYVLGLNDTQLSYRFEDQKNPRSICPCHVPYRSSPSRDGSKLELTLPFGPLNKITSGKILNLNTDSPAISALCHHLRESLADRIYNVQPISNNSTDPLTQSHPKIAILFSGGLDCTILARISHDLLPTEEIIDLLNVAFENPRIHSKRMQDTVSSCIYELCPDRATGRASFEELRKVCPQRKWRFVEINVAYEETLAHRQQVIELMHPHNTEMDLSIALALYFASRGRGILEGTSYETPARVLLSGLGADELFGGYQRHATAFARSGYTGLIDEIELDINRLGKRNLGRDDRVISHWGKEVRFPYLAEKLLSWALSIPVWEKCDFADSDLQGSGSNTGVEAGKRILRLLAVKLNMVQVAKEKKRAIQFGARTAKMQIGKTRGSQPIC